MIKPNTANALLPVDEVQQSFFGGMRDRDHPSQLNKDQYAYGKNIDIRDSGLAKQRLARTTKTNALGNAPQGGIYFEPTPGNGTVIEIQNGQAWQWSGSGVAWTRIGTLQLANKTGPVQLVINQGLVYLLPGSASNDDCWSWNGVAAQWTDLGDSNIVAPFANIGCAQAGRICLSGVISTSTPNVANTRDVIYFSNTYSSVFDRTNNQQRVPTNGSEPVTGLAMYRLLQILAFTRNSTHYYDMSSGNPTTFVRTTLDSELGCIAPLSVVVVGMDAFFLCPDGHIRTINRNTNDQAAGVIGNPVSFWVPNLMARINKANMSKCAGTYFNNYYLLACPLDLNTSNSGVIAFDTLAQIQTPTSYVPACIGEWTNMAALTWIETNFGGKQQLYYIDAFDGSLKLMFDPQEADDGVAIASRIQTRAPNWGTPRHDKTIHDLEIQFLNTVGQATVSYAKDDGSFVTLISNLSIGGGGPQLPINLPFNLGTGPVLFNLPLSFYRRGRSRNWQLQLDFTGGTVQYKETTLAAFIEGAMTR